MIPAVARALHGEALKLKRTLALRMIFVAPALMALLGLLVQSAAIARGRGDLVATLWDSLARGCLTIWALFLMPLLITLETALLCGLEHGARQWKHVFALPVPRYAIYLAKYFMVQGLILLSTLVVCLFIVLSGWILILWHPSLAAAGAPPVWSILGHALECWLAAGLILSVNLWIALRWPTFTVALGAGITGTFFAVFAASSDALRYYPWLLPLNVISSSERVPAALIIGLTGGLVIAVLGGIDFLRREESAPAKLATRSVVAWVLILAVCAGVAWYADRGLLSSSGEPRTVHFVTVDKGVRLEVLDWGGSGRAVVLLAGLGDTAHVFDKFATKLTGEYHVYGITRRGFGASSIPAAGYSADRLGDDVLAVIDSLRISRPVLIGHSIAGEELSSVGSRHPEKVAGLVYLDAAYAYAYYDGSRGDFDIDLSDLRNELEQLKPGLLRDPRPLIAEIAASLPGVEKVLREQLKNLDAMSGSDAPGPQSAAPARSSTQSVRPGLAAAQSITAGEQKYTVIKVPVLAIFALPHDMGPNNQQSEAAEARDINNITGPQAKAFENQVPSARVVRLPHADHYVFQSNEADVLREIDSFIRSLPPN
jgi:pimeloyl-ACP methyl ester carboxylesterase